MHPAGALFCPACGAALAPTCPTCGAETVPGAAFCTRCGTSLADQDAGSTSHIALPSASERKVVTVLFADLAGSTGMAERLDPEATADVLRTYFEAMRAEAEAEGGRVEKFIGDAVMAVFGVPVVHEDDPERAVRAGLAMLHRVDEVNARLARAYDVTLELRVGVNTGSVLATLDAAPGESMVTGDVVNVAARLQAAAESGEVLVSERTARVARCFTYSDRGGLELKGKREPVEASADPLRCAHG
jgi:class 3 adenylate cyclase